MASVPELYDDVQILIPIGMGQLPDDDGDLADLVRFGYFGDDSSDPRVTFDGWLEAQAERIRRHDTPTAAWLARQIDELAELARTLKATTPDEFDARMEVLDQDYAGELRTQGYDACEREQQGRLSLAWGHDA